MKGIELPLEIEEPRKEPRKFRYPPVPGYPPVTSYPPYVQPRGRTPYGPYGPGYGKASRGYSKGYGGYGGGYSRGHNYAPNHRYHARSSLPIAGGSSLKSAPNRRIHAIMERPRSRPASHQYYHKVQPFITSSVYTSSTTYMTSSTTTTTMTSTTTTTSTSTLAVNQSTIKEIILEFSSLLKSTLFQQHLIEVQSGDQIIKTIEFQLPQKVKMEFILNASAEIQTICLDKALFDQNIARRLFKRDFATKLAALNEPEKNILSCK